MKKAIFSSILTAVTITSFGMPNDSVHAEDMSQLQTQGQDIVQKDEDNSKYPIKGVNAGNVFTTEAWLGGYANTVKKNGDDKGYQEVFDQTQDKMGGDANKAHKALEKYADNRWKDNDFKRVKDMGVNTIRLPINYINVTNYDKNMEVGDDKEIDPTKLQIRQEGIDTIKRFVDKAKKHGLYVILDMHGTPNGQNGEAHSTYAHGGQGTFWDDEHSKEKIKQIWHHLSNEFKDNDAIAGYDILNEPKGPEGTKGNQDEINELQKFYKDTLKTIRDNNDDHIAFLEATWDPQDMKDPSYFGENNKNLVYEYHNYPCGEQAKSHDGIKENFDNKIKGIKDANYDVPSYMGEFNGHLAGEGDHIAPNTSDFKHIIKKMNANNLSWTLWNYDKEGKNQDDSSWGTVNFTGIETNLNSNDFGKKKEAETNEVYDAVKDSANEHKT